MKAKGMIHYTCDRCKQVIDPQEDLRYTVRLEIQAALDPVDGGDEDDRDHLLEVQEILERLEDEQSEEIGPDVYERRRYDLCASCYREFIKDPVGYHDSVQLDFSNN